MAAVAWAVFALALFAIWITGHWFGAALALTGAALLCSSGGAIWPNALVLFVLGAAPFMIRTFLFKKKATGQGWGIEVRAFRALQGLRSRF